MCTIGVQTIWRDNAAMKNLVDISPNHVKYAHILDFKIFDDIVMQDANEMECLIF